jgi:hypothetical protein
MSASNPRSSQSQTLRALVTQRFWRIADTLSQAFGRARSGRAQWATYRPPPGPLQRCLLLPSGPERHVNVSMSAASARRRESRDDTKAGAPKRSRVKEQKRFGLTPVTGRLIMQDTPTYRAEAVKEIAGGFVRLEEKAKKVLRRLEERPGFPKLAYAE